MIFTFILIILMFLQVFMDNSYLDIHNKFHYGSLDFSILNCQIRITVLYYTVWVFFQNVFSEWKLFLKIVFCPNQNKEKMLTKSLATHRVCNAKKMFMYCFSSGAKFISLKPVYYITVVHNFDLQEKTT